MKYLLLFLALGNMQLLAADNWPQFRGPDGDGRSDAKGLPVQFGEGDKMKWKTAIHGKGWSCPVIWGSQVWLTTATEDGTELSVLCLDKETGKIIHDKVIFKVATPQFCHKFNSYASPTPVIEDGRIYINFGSPGTACLDTKTAEVIWERRDFVCDHYRGAGSSPIVWENLLIMHYDGADNQFVVAVDKTTGKTVWEVKRSVDHQDILPDGKIDSEGDFRKAFATPHVAEIGGKPVLLSSGAKCHYAYDPKTGTELWRVEERAQHSASSRPVVGHGLVFIQTGFSKAQLLAIKPEGSGLLGPDNEVWREKKNIGSKPSLILDGEYLYGIDDGGIASCLEAKTGKVLWRERVNGDYSASPILAEGRLYFCSEQGLVTVIAAAPEFKVLAQTKFEDGFMASPAVSGEALYLRSRAALYRFDE